MGFLDDLERTTPLTRYRPMGHLSKERPPGVTWRKVKKKVTYRRSRLFPPYEVAIEQTTGGYSVRVLEDGKLRLQTSGMDSYEANRLFDDTSKFVMQYTQGKFLPEGSESPPDMRYD